MFRLVWVSILARIFRMVLGSVSAPILGAYQYGKRHINSTLTESTLEEVPDEETARDKIF